MATLGERSQALTASFDIGGFLDALELERLIPREQLARLGLAKP
jgi:hypothetical protein